MAPDRVDVDPGDLQAARQLLRAAIEYMEQELGVDTSQPAAGRLPRARLWVLRHDLERLATLLERLTPTNSATPSA